jgi:tetratricopeptide (TPR) repeat protein
MTPDLSQTVALAESNPADLGAQVRAANACDREGHEADAIKFYDAAWRLGASGAERAQFLLGYGSTLRNVGRLEESLRVLSLLLSECPDHHAAMCFRGLALHSSGQHDQAVVEFLDLALLLRGASPSLMRYERALTEYRDALREEAARSTARS